MKNTNTVKKDKKEEQKRGENGARLIINNKGDRDNFLPELIGEDRLVKRIKKNNKGMGKNRKKLLKRVSREF